MKVFHNLSIRKKLISVILFVSALTMIVGFAILGMSDVKNLKREMHQNALMNTKLIGEYSIAPLTFDDKVGAESILSKLSTIPDVMSGALYDRNGDLFAYYKKTKDINVSKRYDNPDELTESETSFKGFLLEVNHPIFYGGFKYGVIKIEIDTSILKEKIKNYIFIMMGILSGMLVLSYILANSLQKPILQPILELANLTRKISKEGNYNVRIDKKGNDEIGGLYENFNNMLQQILNREHARDEAEKQLLRAKEKAEESDLLKSAFLANMSHEIRTPMNAILGFTELISIPDSEISPQERDNFIKLINISGNNLLQLIDDIIDISKIEAGQLKILMKECNINTTLQDLKKSFLEIRKHKNKENVDIRLNENAESQNLVIKTDPLRFSQVITNLIDNALKFTDNGYIEFGYEEKSSKELLFYVKDTGNGMDTGKKDMVFERFTKIENDNSKLYRGAGLGLAICKSLVELLGGEIWVESTPSVGSVFYFTLPFTKIETSKKRIREVYSSKTYNWNDKTILIAEDESANSIYIEEVLKITGAQVLKAFNGKEALEIFKKNEIDVVIMDIKMPEMDGLEATKKMKEINKKIPVISQSAYAMPGDIDKGLKSGMDEYLIKPVKPSVLLSVINKYIADLTHAK